MLMRTGPSYGTDRPFRRPLAPRGTWTRPAPIPADVHREGEDYVITLDLPGVSTQAIDVRAEGSLLTVEAERRPAESGDAQLLVSERPLGVFARRLRLAGRIDADRVTAHHHAGVLTLRVPVAPSPERRRITVDGQPEPPASGC
ncbi:Hsp20/alpha crystallin family protein [Streptomyces sp. NPDC059740]|uniref:Hsp20/alpha crystallin family protein n=1 Tax=Streptomyces sp. NPDC059740 TaxID=3346926 RepID=UPI00365F9350